MAELPGSNCADQSRLVFDRSTQNSAADFLTGLGEAEYQRLRGSLSLSGHSAPERSPRDCNKYGYRSNEDLSKVLRREIYSHVFNKLPLRLISLQEMKLKERSEIAKHLTTRERVRDGEKKIKERESKAFKAQPDMTPVQRNRLRDTVVAEWVENVTRFVVLSHTWEGGELTYQDVHVQCNSLSAGLCRLGNGDDADRVQSFEKLLHFCKVAEQYGADFAWADTVCINKSSSAELDESIRSMFSWYRNATVCIAYLAETDDLRNLVHDRWFTRGWTLQELLAPRHLKFYNKFWHRLTDFVNDKISPEDVRALNDTSLSRQLDLLSSAVHKATRIDMHHVRNFIPGICYPCLPQRMQWVAQRVTTREEDESYSLMGIFDISISTAYGEGRERAFFRLFQAILEVGYEREWFLWPGHSVSPSIHPSRMIPSSPKCYLGWNVNFARHTPEGKMVQVLENEPAHLTNVGLPMKVLFVPATLCEPGRSSRFLDYSSSEARITCRLTNKAITIRGIHRDSNVDSSVQEQFALGILNVNVEEEGAPCPDRLYAILLRRLVPRASQSCHTYENWKKCDTEDVIVLECVDKSQVSKREVGRSVDQGFQNGSGDRGQLGEKMGFRKLYL